MTYVLIASQPNGTLQDVHGEARSDAVEFRQANGTAPSHFDGTLVSHYADNTGASPLTTPITPDSKGRLMRYILGGTYKQIINPSDTSRRESLDFHAVGGSLESNIGVFVPVATGVAATDTANIAAAVTALTTGQTLSFPPRQTYVVATTGGTFQAVANITASKVSIYGNGSTIQMDATADVGTIAFRVSASDTHIAGFHFNGNGLSQIAGVRIEDASARPRIAFNDFLDCRLQLLSATDAQIRGNAFRGIGYGIITNPDSIPSGVSIIGNTFRGANSAVVSGDAISINTPTNGSSNFTISGNIISDYVWTTNANAGFGIALARVSRATVTGNMVSNCSRNGVHVEDLCDGVTVSGNTIYSTQHAGIEVQTAGSGLSPANVNITGNTVENCCTVADAFTLDLSKGGIQVGNNVASAVRVKGVQIIGNNVSGCGTATNSAAGIYAYECRRTPITGNTCRNNRAAGIFATSPVESMIVSNVLTDDQGTKTQAYAIKLAGSDDDLAVIANDMIGNLTAATETSGSTASATRKFILNRGQTAFGTVNVTGSRGGNAALASLLTILASENIITDGSTV